MSAEELLDTFAVEGPGCDGCGDTESRKRPVSVLINEERYQRYYCDDCDPLEEIGVESIVRDPWGEQK